MSMSWGISHNMVLSNNFEMIKQEAPLVTGRNARWEILNDLSGGHCTNDYAVRQILSFTQSLSGIIKISWKKSDHDYFFENCD